MQVDVFILYVGNKKKCDASSAGGYITGMHFSNTLRRCGQRLFGMSSCGLGCWEIIPMALIDVYGLLVTILHGVHELMIWLCFGVGGCFHVYLQSQEIE